MYCNDEMLRIIGRTIEYVIGRSSQQLEGIETEAKESGALAHPARGHQNRNSGMDLPVLTRLLMAPLLPQTGRRIHRSYR